MRRCSRHCQSNPRLAVHVLSIALDRLTAAHGLRLHLLTKGKLSTTPRRRGSLNAAITRQYASPACMTRVPRTAKANAAEPSVAPRQAPGLRLTASLSRGGRAGDLTSDPLARCEKRETPDTTILQRSAPQFRRGAAGGEISRHGQPRHGEDSGGGRGRRPRPRDRAPPAQRRNGEIRGLAPPKLETRLPILFFRSRPQAMPRPRSAFASRSGSAATRTPSRRTRRQLRRRVEDDLS